MIGYVFAALALVAPSLANAAEAGTVIALTPAQAEAAKEAGAARHAREATLNDAFVGSRAIHGEVGFGIGTGGYREVFGTAVAPLGDTGMIALSFDNAQFGRGYRYRR